MSDQASRAENFKGLHVKGEPVILFNAWDGGSARTISESGAKAIAMGDHPVGFAHGYTNDNFADFTFETYLNTIREVNAVIGELPQSVDISNGEGLSLEELKQRVRTLLEIGVVGINFEDRLPDSSDVLSITEQAEKIKAIRAAAEEFGVPLFINARTDLFTTHDKSEYAALLDEIGERAAAYQAAGANGLFAPGLTEGAHIKQLCEATELPVNIIKLPGTPTIAELSSAGVARISYGPIAYFRMTEWLKEHATKVLNGDD